MATKKGREKEYQREWQRRRYAADPKFREKQCARARKRRADNPENAAKIRRRWRDKNPQYRIVNNVCRAVKRGVGEKSHRTEYYLGYPLAEIVEWVKRQGGIPRGYHIDHIVPVKWWLARYPDDIVRAMRGAWRLGNLRIIPAAENQRKHAKREFLV